MGAWKSIKEYLNPIMNDLRELIRLLNTSRREPPWDEEKLQKGRGDRSEN